MDWITGVHEFVTSSRFTSVAFAIIFFIVLLRLVRRTTLPVTYGRRLFLVYTAVVGIQLVAVVAWYWFQWHRSTCGLGCPYYFPPYSNYYFNQVIVRWMSTFAFNACVGLTGGMLFMAFARRTQWSIVDRLDVDMLTVGGMIAGWPNILILYALVFVGTVLVSVTKAIVHKSASVRMVITPVLPVAISVVALFGTEIARFMHVYEIGLTLVGN